MFITIDANDRRAIYQQVVDGIKGLIARGDLPEGTALPSVRQLANDLGVNLNTIAIAYRELASEGFIAVKHGMRAVVTSRRATERNEEEIRKSLRTVLTRLVLAGMPRKEILNIITDELEELLHGAKQ